MSHDQANEGFARAAARGDAGFVPRPDRVTHTRPTPPRRGMQDERNIAKRDANGLADAIEAFLRESGWDGDKGPMAVLAQTVAAYRQRQREGAAIR